MSVSMSLSHRSGTSWQESHGFHVSLLLVLLGSALLALHVSDDTPMMPNTPTPADMLKIPSQSWSGPWSGLAARKREKCELLPEAVTHRIAVVASKWIYYVKSQDDWQTRNMTVMYDQISYDVQYCEEVVIPEDLESQQHRVAGITLCISHVYAEVKHDCRILVVAFRGSVEVRDWVANAAGVVNWDNFHDYGLGVHAGWAALLSDHHHGAHTNSTTNKLLAHINKADPGLLLITGGWPQPTCCPSQPDTCQSGIV